MDMIMASRDLACVSVPDDGFCSGARVRDASACWWGRGGGPMVKGLLMPGPMKSGRGRDWRRWCEGKGNGVVGLLAAAARTGA